VDRRLQITEIITASLDDLSTRTNIPLLHSIRTDTTVTKSCRAKRFLIDFEPKAKALEDYQIALEQLLDLLNEKQSLNSITETAAATASV